MKRLLTAAAMLVGLSVSAQASVTLDFTDASVFAGAHGAKEYTTTVGGFEVKITAIDLDDMTSVFNLTPFDGSVVPTGLAGDFDGVGISTPRFNDDEVTSDQFEFIKIEFTNAKVFVESISFLDLFVSPYNNEYESVGIDFNGGEAYYEADAVEEINSAPLGGYALFTFAAPDATKVSSIVFSALNTGNDSVGVSDFALASLTITSVPEAGTWLLMLAGFGFSAVALRRRKIAGPVAA